MKRLTITLADGDHVIASPNFAALALMEDAGVNLAEGVNLGSTRSLAVILAALLTASEPLADGHFSRVWTWEEAGLLLDGESAPRVIDAITKLLTDSFPESGDEDGSARPTKARASSSKQ